MSRADVADVVRAKAGDTGAFDRLAASVVDRLLQVARLILRDPELAEDAAQDALIRCWRDLPSLRDPGAFDAWLNRLLIRAVQEQYRLLRRHRGSVTMLHLEPGHPDDTQDIATREQLARGFERLTLEHRSVLVLRLYLGFSLEETALTLGIPAGTAKSRLHYATEAMREALEADARPPLREVSA